MNPPVGRAHVRWSVALALVLSLAGCGVPDSGPPVVHERVDEVLDVGEEDVEPPPQPDARDAKGAVQQYFEAASSEWGDLRDQVGRFLTEEATVPMSSTILVLRDLRLGEPGVPDPERPDVQRVRVSGRVTGELTQNGTMRSASGAFSYAFDVVREELKDEDVLRQQPQTIWRVKNPPPQYVLSEDALDEWYTSATLYFSNRRSPTLIPESRYVAKAVWVDKPGNLLVDWVLAGPSEWLSPVAVSGFSNGTRRLGNVVRDEKHVVVDLKSANEQLTRTQFGQLAWTLRPLMAGRQLQVRIEGRPVSYDGRQSYSLDDFESLNGVTEGPDGPIGYYVRAGKVTRLMPGETPEALAGPNDETYNKHVVSAALSRAGDLAALVRRQDAQWSLWVGRRSSGPSRNIRYHEVSGLPPGPIGTPEWAAGIGGAPGSFLVTVAGVVYQVELGKRAVEVATRWIGEVDAVSVAPDGFRVAMISRGRLYLGGLRQDGDDVMLQELRPVTDQFRHVADVAWSGEHELVVVDRELWKVQVDGLSAVKLPRQGKSLTQVAAYPTIDGNAPALATVDDSIYEVHSKEMAPPAGHSFAPAGRSPFFGF